MEILALVVKAVIINLQVIQDLRVEQVVQEPQDLQVVQEELVLQAIQEPLVVLVL